jgi:hypothetical protein
LRFALPPACFSISAHLLKISSTALGTRPVFEAVSEEGEDPMSVPIEYDLPEEV